MRREIGNGDERPTGGVREWCCKRVKTTGATKRTYGATREGKGPVAGSRLGFGSCRDRTRTEEGAGVFQEGRRGNDETERGRFPGGVRQGGVGGSGRGEERIAS